MLSLSQIEAELIEAIKAKDQLTVDTLRGLKTRIQNEKISKMKDLEEADVVALVRSEVKRRKDAIEAFKAGNRPELADKELQEAKILERYLPAQMSEEQLRAVVDQAVAENNFAAKDFGAAMGKLKTRLGAQADGAMLARLLKEKLK
jgi:uncharacterized protein